MTMRYIDSHAHIWDLSSVDYPWLVPALEPLYRTHPLGELEPQLLAANVESVILVQAANSLAETEYLLACASQSTRVAGVVGWVDLQDPDAAESSLERWMGDPKFVGIRHLLHDERDPGFVTRPKVLQSLRALARRGLPFDIPNAWPSLMDPTLRLAREIPELVLVLDHLGKPPRASPEDLPAWRDAVTRLAAHPNVVAKFSGLRVPHAAWSYAAIEPMWDFALGAFGAERLMWGSDWPMFESEGGYEDTWSILRELMEQVTGDEHASLAWRTAERTYRIS